MIRVTENKEFNSPNRTLICKCPKCGKDFARQLNEDDICADNTETGMFFDCYCCEHFVTQCPKCGHIFWDDDDCIKELMRAYNGE